MPNPSQLAMAGQGITWAMAIAILLATTVAACGPDHSQHYRRRHLLQQEDSMASDGGASPVNATACNVDPGVLNATCAGGGDQPAPSTLPPHTHASVWSAALRQARSWRRPAPATATLLTRPGQARIVPL